MFIARFGLALALCFAATLVSAACSGTDLRQTLTQAERADIEARLARTPYAEGNVWTATRGAKTLHLIGTMHLDDARFGAVMTRLAPLVRAADLLFVEATAEEEAALERAITTRPELVFLTTGPTLPELLPEAEWQALANAARARGVPAFMAAKMQPWYLAILLTMPGCSMQDMQKGMSGLDKRVMDLAARANVPMRALEPYDTLFSLMSEDPLEAQAQMLSVGVLPDAVAEDAFATLTNSYFEEKNAEVLEVNRILAYRHVDLPKPEIDALLDEMLETLLDRRNAAWMGPILAAPDGTIVVAAGAAHLPGETGLLALLEAEGFTLERGAF